MLTLKQSFFTDINITFDNEVQINEDNYVFMINNSKHESSKVVLKYTNIK